MQVVGITCKPPPETPCGYISDYFTVSTDVTFTCSEEGRCDFMCLDPTNFISIATVFCHPGSTSYSPPGGLVECHGDKDTPCGDIEDLGITIESQKECTGNLCTFTCQDDEIVKGIV